jgi:hypothetical protein
MKKLFIYFLLIFLFTFTASEQYKPILVDRISISYNDSFECQGYLDLNQMDKDKKITLNAYLPKKIGSELLQGVKDTKYPKRDDRYLYKISFDTFYCHNDLTSCLIELNGSFRLIQFRHYGNSITYLNYVKLAFNEIIEKHKFTQISIFMYDNQLDDYSMTRLKWVLALTQDKDYHKFAEDIGYIFSVNFTDEQLEPVFKDFGEAYKLFKQNLLSDAKSISKALDAIKRAFVLKKLSEKKKSKSIDKDIKAIIKEVNISGIFKSISNKYSVFVNEGNRTGTNHFVSGYVNQMMKTPDLFKYIASPSLIRFMNEIVNKGVMDKESFELFKEFLFNNEIFIVKEGDEYEIQDDSLKRFFVMNYPIVTEKVKTMLFEKKLEEMKWYNMKRFKNWH